MVDIEAGGDVDLLFDVFRHEEDDVIEHNPAIVVTIEIRKSLLKVSLVKVSVWIDELANDGAVGAQHGPIDETLTCSVNLVVHGDTLAVHKLLQSLVLLLLPDYLLDVCLNYLEVVIDWIFFFLVW